MSPFQLFVYLLNSILPVESNIESKDISQNYPMDVLRIFQANLKRNFSLAEKCNIS